MGPSSVCRSDDGTGSSTAGSLGVAAVKGDRSDGGRSDDSVLQPGGQTPGSLRERNASSFTG